jgi:hypothetical protein
MHQGKLFLWRQFYRPSGTRLDGDPHNTAIAIGIAPASDEVLAAVQFFPDGLGEHSFYGHGHRTVTVTLPGVLFTMGFLVQQFNIPGVHFRDMHLSSFPFLSQYDRKLAMAQV